MRTDDGNGVERAGVISSDILKYDGTDGLDLMTIVELGGPMEPREVAAVARQLVQALSGLHSAGLVHRDVSPSTVFFDRLPNGRPSVRLVDFGSVCAIGSPSSGQFVGDSGFAAPELIRNEPADARTDIYQLGCLLHFLLTAEPPFRGVTRRDVLDAHLHQSAPRASDLTPSIRRWLLDDLILQMLDKDPDARPSNFEVIAAALDDPSRSQDHASAASVSVVGPDDSVVTVTGRRMVVRRGDTVSHFDMGKTSVTAVCTDAGRVYYGTESGMIGELDVARSTRADVTRLARGHRIVQMTSGGENLLVADAAGDVFLVRRSGEYRVIRRPPGRISSTVAALAVATDASRTIAVARTDRSVTVYTGRTPARSARLTIEFPVEQLAISPDGYIVAVIGDGATWIVNALDGRVLHRLRVHRRGTFTFRGPTLVGLERTDDGRSRSFEVY